MYAGYIGVWYEDFKIKSIKAILYNGVFFFGVFQHYTTAFIFCLFVQIYIVILVTCFKEKISS